MRGMIMAALVAVGIGGAVLAAPSVASATPAAYTGYHATGPISPAGELRQCLTANSAEAHAQIYVVGCVEHDALQQWVAISVAGTVLIALEAHPNLYIGGIPGERGGVELYDLPKNQDVPINQSTFIGGSLKRYGASNSISSITRGYMSLPKQGHSVVWGGRFTRGNNRSWVFKGGWITETIEAQK